MSISINCDRERKYPVDRADPIGTRAHDELMRVTGMGEYAQDVRGGPPGKIRISIPAQEEYDTDCVIGAALRERKALRAEVARYRAALGKIAIGGCSAEATRPGEACYCHECISNRALSAPPSEGGATKPPTNPVCACGHRAFDHEKDERGYRDLCRECSRCTGYHPIAGQVGAP